MNYALTGHRPGKKLDPIQPRYSMIELLGELRVRDSGIRVISGGADGADRLWAKAAWVLGIPYDIFVPKGYGEHYKLGDWFWTMLDLAANVRWTQEKGAFNTKLNFVRNQQMADAMDRGVVCSYKEPSQLLAEDKRGGTRDGAKRFLASGKPYWWVNSLTGDRVFYPKVQQEGLL